MVLYAIYISSILLQSTEWTTELSPGWSEARAEPWVDHPPPSTNPRSGWRKAPPATANHPSAAPTRVQLLGASLSRAGYDDALPPPPSGVQCWWGAGDPGFRSKTLAARFRSPPWAKFCRPYRGYITGHLFRHLTYSRWFASIRGSFSWLPLCSDRLRSAATPWLRTGMKAFTKVYYIQRERLIPHAHLSAGMAESNEFSPAVRKD